MTRADDRGHRHLGDRYALRAALEVDAARTDGARLDAASAVVQDRSAETVGGEVSTRLTRFAGGPAHARARLRREHPRTAALAALLPRRRRVAGRRGVGR